MNVGAIILAGGKSSRMGEDKGLLEINGKSMIEHVIQTLQIITNNIVIVTNNNTYQKFGLPVVEDLITNAGPLAGIYTGLSHSKHDKNIVISCDVPMVSAELLQYLIKNSATFDVTIPSYENKTHQVIGVYDKKCTLIFKTELDNNQRIMKVALQKINLNIVDAIQFDAKEFTNINTPDELKNAQ